MSWPGLSSFTNHNLDQATLNVVSGSCTVGRGPMRPGCGPARESVPVTPIRGTASATQLNYDGALLRPWWGAQENEMVG